MQSTVQMTIGRKAASDTTPLVIPDAAIRVYFALFPIIVAMFLSVQAVRTQAVHAVAANSTEATTVTR